MLLLLLFVPGKAALPHIPCKVKEKTPYPVTGALLKQCEHMSYFANIFVRFCFFRNFAILYYNKMQYQI